MSDMAGAASSTQGSNRRSPKASRRSKGVSADDVRATMDNIPKQSIPGSRSNERPTFSTDPRPQIQLPDTANSYLLQLLRQSQAGILGNQLLQQTGPALGPSTTSYPFPTAFPYQSTSSYPNPQPGLSWPAQSRGLQALNHQTPLSILLNLQATAPQLSSGLLFGGNQSMPPLIDPHAPAIGPALALPPLAPMPAPLTVRAKVRRRYRHESFPEKLYRILTEAEEQGKDDIISFVADGTAVAIHRPEALVDEIVPKYFRHKKLSSFMRQLSMYGFQRIATRTSDNTFEHPLFKKGRPELCRQMKRVNELEVVHATRGSMH